MIFASSHIPWVVFNIDSIGLKVDILSLAIKKRGEFTSRKKMSDAWEEIQAIKIKRNSLRERLQKRKKERQDILNLSSIVEAAKNDLPIQPKRPATNCPDTEYPDCVKVDRLSLTFVTTSALFYEQGKEIEDEEENSTEALKSDREIELALLETLCELSLSFPTSSINLCTILTKKLGRMPSHDAIINLLLKFSTQQLIHIKDIDSGVEVVSAETIKLQAMICDATHEQHIAVTERLMLFKQKRKSVEKEAELLESPIKALKAIDKDDKKKEKKATDIMSLLSMPSTKEKQTKRMGEEILDLLSKPTAKEKSLAERFRSNGAHVMEFCPLGTRDECAKESLSCSKLHFKKILQKHTDESLGDCSFLNTCFHMDTCKYVHYEVDGSTVPSNRKNLKDDGALMSDKTILYPPQWIQCDLRYLDMTVLGKFAVIMADPPWDIHMELPYGTMSDDEMRQLGVPTLQDNGVIFLWVTGRAMELGRECLQLWGYERVDEIIWVKTNQLQRIIRTGRTGHWLNHGKEHCLVGKKGSVDSLNRGLDCDVIVAEVRATSHKPDEIYGIIERLSPGTRKIELFGRPHNVQPNWITLGNQVDGVRLVDPDLISAFRKRYPDGNCMVPPQEIA